MLIFSAGVVLAAEVPYNTYANSSADQAQGQAQELTNSGNSAVVFENSFNGSQPIRYLPVTSGVSYQGMSPQMFSRPQQDKGENFVSASNLISMMGAWNLNNLADADFNLKDVKIDITTVNLASTEKTSIKRLGTRDMSRVSFSIQGSDVAKKLRSAQSNRRVLALGTIKSDDDDINSFELFYALAKKAKEIGGTNIILIGEGVKIELSSSGWGLGLSYNMATVNSDAYGSGQVGAGGTGISGGSASYSKMPYLSFAIVE